MRFFLASDSKELIKAANKNLMNLQTLLVRIRSQYQVVPGQQPQQYFASEDDAIKQLQAALKEVHTPIATLFLPKTCKVDVIGEIKDYNAHNAHENKSTLEGLAKIQAAFPQNPDNDNLCFSAVCDEMRQNEDPARGCEERAMQVALKGLLAEWKTRQDTAKHTDFTKGRQHYAELAVLQDQIGRAHV